MTNEQKDNQNLKPCPFCGDISPELMENRAARDMSLVYVHCNSCGADGPPCDYNEEAINEWNKSSNPLKSEVIRSAFRSALSWGMVYGPVLSASQWDEMREEQVKQLYEQITKTDPPLHSHEWFAQRVKRASDNINSYPPSIRDNLAVASATLPTKPKSMAFQYRDEQVAKKMEFAYSTLENQQIQPTLDKMISKFEVIKLVNALIEGGVLPESSMELLRTILTDDQS